MTDTIIDWKNHPTVKALSEHQTRLSLSDTVFAKRYLNCSPASWSLMRSGTYKVQDPQPMLDRCEMGLATLNDQAAQIGDAGDRARIVDLTTVKAALKAVKACYGAPQNRLVVYLAPSGGGKTTLSRKLAATYLGACITVEATETWRGSYFNALVACCEACGITEAFTNPRAAESALIDYLAVRTVVLAIDEGHYCGPQALNLLKVLLNRTQTRIVLLAIPQLWTRMATSAYEEVQQLRRRTAAMIVVTQKDGISAADVRAFLAVKLPGYSGLNGDATAVVSAATAAANAFGLYDTLERICAEVSNEVGDGDATLDAVKAAIKNVEALRS